MYRCGENYGPVDDSVNMGCVKDGRFLESPSKRELVKKVCDSHELSVVSVA